MDVHSDQKCHTYISAMQCPHPPDVSFADFMDIPSIVFDTNATYVCNDGYKNILNDTHVTIECLYNETTGTTFWSKLEGFECTGNMHPSIFTLLKETRKTIWLKKCFCKGRRPNIKELK